MTRYMLAHFGQGVADGTVRVEGVVVFAGIPFLKGREALRHGGEETDNDLDRCAFHLLAKVVHQSALL